MAAQFQFLSVVTQNRQHEQTTDIGVLVSFSCYISLFSLRDRGWRVLVSFSCYFSPLKDGRKARSFSFFQLLQREKLKKGPLALGFQFLSVVTLFCLFRKELTNVLVSFSCYHDYNYCQWPKRKFQFLSVVTNQVDYPPPFSPFVLVSFSCYLAVLHDRYLVEGFSFFQLLHHQARRQKRLTRSFSFFQLLHLS